MSSSRTCAVSSSSETVKVGDDIDVTVVSVKGNKVQLGFEAPDYVPVYREEVYRRIRGEDDAA